MRTHPPAPFTLTRRQTLETVVGDEEARARGFPRGGPFQLLERDIVLPTLAEAAAARKTVTEKNMLNTVSC